MKNLSIEFWNDMTEKYPQAMAAFRNWIDDYKADIFWNMLFRPTAAGYEYPKYHDVPLAMQWGIFLQYVIESNCKKDGVTNLHLAPVFDVQTISKYVETFFKFRTRVFDYSPKIYKV